MGVLGGREHFMQRIVEMLTALWRNWGGRVGPAGLPGPYAAPAAHRAQTPHKYSAEWQRVWMRDA